MITYDAMRDDHTSRPHYDESTLLRRYRRIVKLCQWVACLSQGEATACVRDYRSGLEYSGEAVNSYGGTCAVLQAAVAKRTNYGLLAMLGLGTQRTCQSCIDHTDCVCCCAMCAATRNLLQRG